RLSLLFHHDAARLVLLFRFGALGGHGFFHPLIGGLEVHLPLHIVAAFNFGLLAVHQIHVGHGVVVILAQLQSFIEFLDAVAYHVLVLGAQLVAYLGILQRLIGLEAD